MFDNVCKFLAETFSADMAQWLLGDSTPLTQLSPSELSLEPIRADSLILLQSEQTVLHIEFQTQPDPEMPFRMLDYSVRIRRRFPHKLLHQVVIYLKETTSRFAQQTRFESATTHHDFQVLRLWQQPVDPLLNRPGLLPFAILGQTANREALLEQIACEIEAIANPKVQNNLVASTAILAGLVLEGEFIQRVLRSDIMKESVIYQEILAEGQQQGKVQGERSLVFKLLHRRVGEVSSDLQAQINQLPLADLESLGEALLDFTSVDDLVTWLQQRSQ